MDFTGYLRQARTLPPHVVLRRAAALAARTATSWGRLASDLSAGSYGTARSRLNPAARISINAVDIPPDLEETLRCLGREYLAHRFELLGSRWTQPIYGFQAGGFLGHRYTPHSPKAPDQAGHGLSDVVNRSNLPHSLQVWRLIARPDYTPIDWQLDWRSGYRWSARRPSVTLPIPVDRGADVKLPWELGRLQHLPQLALCAILARDGRPNFEAASRYVEEISDQLADFIATNPPRFGVNWMGAMDVAIRAANIALTLALLAGAGLALSPEMSQAAANALNDHAEYVVGHLEYSETGRSNHYLADLGGVLWSSWMLSGPAADARLIFAGAEILKEADYQFLADGGNYEGSTSYHRLSAEIVLFALAVICSLDHTALERLERAAPPRRPWRAVFPVLPLRRHRSDSTGASLVPPAVWQKLQGAARLSRAVQGADGTIVQIGDTDSGRFFKLHPTALPPQSAAADNGFAENSLDHSGFINAVDVLLGADPQGRRLDASLVRRLAGWTATQGLPQAAPDVADFGDLDALLARWQGTPDASRRVRHIPLGMTVDPAAWTRLAFPDFGLYVFRHADLLISFRCYDAPPPAAPNGHRHDDNLSVEYRLPSARRRDPGSYVYTPSVAQRNRYRAAAAHDVPRARGKPLTTVGNALFDLKQNAYAQCLCWRATGVAGKVNGPSGEIMRILQISSQQLSIFDCVEPPAEIDDLSPELPVSLGYGRL
ncbi:MAG TPA: heparinase II/III family protein [Pseudolabrys sp.]|nr:heparinase II/III family protein [Pseudolabrys sp.]